MVRLQVALASISLLTASSAESQVSQSINTKSQFRSVMRKVLRDQNTQKLQTRRMLKQLEDKIVSKSKGIRKLDEYYQTNRSDDNKYYAKEEENVANETEYYAAEEIVEYYSSHEDEEEKVEYYTKEEDDQEVVEYYTESGEEETYYNKAWGHDDNYDYDDLTFDLSKFSLKMHSCRSLTDFDLDSLDQEQLEEKEYEREQLSEISYPFSGVPYVSYRLCPTSTCQDDDWQGCREVYGNYMISLEDYFEITEQHLEEELEEYCDYCKQCNYFYKYFNATCQYYNECNKYANVCYEDGGDDGAMQINYEDLFECTAVEKSYYKQYYNRRTEEEEEEDYDENVYLKLFCDGSIKIGIFSDDECTNYIGKTTTIYQSTGMKVLEDDLESDFMHHDCIHCGKSNHKYYAMSWDKYDKNQNADDAQEGDDEIYDICETLYEDSAKCNAFLPEPVTDNENAYYKYYQEGYYGYDEDWEQTKTFTACAYMEAVQKNNIDKYGVVHLSYNHYFKDYINKINNDILPGGYFVTDKQFFAIIGGAVFTLTLLIYSCTKPRKVVYNKELKATLV